MIPLGTGLLCGADYAETSVRVSLPVLLCEPSQGNLGRAKASVRIFLTLPQERSHKAWLNVFLQSLRIEKMGFRGI